MNNISIRNAKSSDISNLAVLIKEIEYNDYVKENTILSIEQSIKKQFELCTHDTTHKLLIAEENNQILVGYCLIHLIPHMFLAGPEVYISDLFIKPIFRGKDIGSSFIEYVKNYAIDQKCSRLSLLNGRDRESYKRSFYAKKGFIERPNLANFIYLI